MPMAEGITQHKKPANLFHFFPVIPGEYHWNYFANDEKLFGK
jgi:hypothetical protein